MGNHSLVTNLLPESSLAIPVLIIEQEEQDDTDGYLSRAGMYRSINALLNQESPDDPECVDECTTTIYVYRYDLATTYHLDVSHGDLGPRITEDHLYYTEKIKISMDDEASLKYPCFGVIESRWIGDKVWDQDGGEIAEPSFIVSLTSLKFNVPVYGTLAVTYRINRDKYSLVLPKREASIENKYSSVAYTIYPGGIDWKVIEPPTGVEETDQQCTGGRGGSVSISGPANNRNIPVAAYADRSQKIDYCTQEAEEPTLTEHVDWEAQEI